MRAAPAAFLAVLMVASSPAGATASLSCTGEDRWLAFSIEAVVSHGVGEAVTGLKGEATIRLKGVSEGLRTQTFEGGHLTQAWVRGRDLRLRIYRDGPEGGPGGSVELVVETRGPGGDATDFRGTYELVVEYLASASDSEARTAKARGRAACSLG